jgi:serine/threonine-protein kinase RsbW
MTLTLPRDSRFLGPLRTSLGALLEPLAVPEGAVEDLQLALTEACSNAFVHAEGTRHCRVSVLIDSGRCTVRVIDHGPGFSLSEVQAREPDLLSETGRGLHVVEAVSDELSVEPRENGVVVRFVKSWSLGEQAPGP